MKHEILGIIGKTIAGIVVNRAETSPRSQVFLIFSDGTYFELYVRESNTHIEGATGLSAGGVAQIHHYLRDHGQIVLEAAKPPSPRLVPRATDLGPSK
jgi:hypothetical protein